MHARFVCGSTARLGFGLLLLASGCTGSISDRGRSDNAVTADAVDARVDSQVVDSGVDNAPAPLDASTLIEVDAATPWLDAAVEAQSDAQAIDAAGDADLTGCGDKKLQVGEVCDDGNSVSGDGCSADCHDLEQDYVCPQPGQACVSSVVCGDGRVSGRENCDDGNARSGDGCSELCKLETGYVCLSAASACTAARCGDGVVAADETCDDGNAANGDGCSANCRLELGYVCPRAGAHCQLTSCNDGVKQGSEACDDGNQVVGDGCTPFCEVEPDCSLGACRSRCGDGLVLPNDTEACDDGNTNDHDGCSADCKIEKGYVCTLEPRISGDVLTVPATYRDFIASPNLSAPADPTSASSRHPDFEVFGGSAATRGLVMDRLDSMGKPVFAGVCDDSGIPYPVAEPRMGPCPYNQQLTTRANFDQWYRDVPAVNVTKVTQMMLTRSSDGRSYQITNARFFPWDGDATSWVGRGREQLLVGHDFGFTSEIRYYFTYQGNPDNLSTLSFSGDDDVWVFINRHLAVDIGGLHAIVSDSVTLDAPTAQRLGLEAAQIYEIALFHAERHSGESNFNLTLEGFDSAHSRCQTQCGDGVVAGAEVCDDGKNDGSYGSCTPDCRRAAHCGDANVEAGREACDDGVNQTSYSANGMPACAPGCKLSAYCGDGHIDSLAGETCDDGMNRGGYGQCGSTCQLGPRCGDRVIQVGDGETCDDGNRINGDGCSSMCHVEVPE